MRMEYTGLGVGLLAAGLLAGCLGGGGTQAPSGNGGTPERPAGLQFWHTRTGVQEAALKEICADYERDNPGEHINPEYQGNYDDLNKKIRAAILGKQLPALTVAYESHVTEYMKNGVVEPLDPLVADPQTGLSKSEMADIPDQYLASNRFAQFDNKLLSFPFTKSNLVFYYNRSLLQKAGISAPPQTWEEFEQQAATLTRQIGAPAFVFTADPSTLDGFVYSFGGDVLAKDGVHTLFDQTPAVKMFEMLGHMAQAKTLTLVQARDEPNIFSSQRCAFAIDSSSSRATLEDQVKDAFDWDIAPIPHAAGVKPVTVMYGPNVCIFKGDPAQEKAAWKFVKYFISPKVTAKWARLTGYLPVSKSAVDLPEMKQFYKENPRAWHVYQILPTARGEPNVMGWQEVRQALQDAATAVVTSGTPASQAAADLKTKADQILAQSK